LVWFGLVWYKTCTALALEEIYEKNNLGSHGRSLNGWPHQLRKKSRSAKLGIKKSIQQSSADKPCRKYPKSGEDREDRRVFTLFPVACVGKFTTKLFGPDVAMRLRQIQSNLGREYQRE